MLYIYKHFIYKYYILHIFIFYFITVTMYILNSTATKSHIRFSVKNKEQRGARVV